MFKVDGWTLPAQVKQGGLPAPKDKSQRPNNNDAKAVKPEARRDDKSKLKHDTRGERVPGSRDGPQSRAQTQGTKRKRDDATDRSSNSRSQSSVDERQLKKHGRAQHDIEEKRTHKPVSKAPEPASTPARSDKPAQPVPRDSSRPAPPTNDASAAPSELSNIPTDRLTPMQRKMLAKLSGAHFRWINERLYTTTGSDALALVQARPDLFDAYHRGFREQVLAWPENPIELYKSRAALLARRQQAADADAALPKHAMGRPLKLIDLGCGEAALGRHILSLDRAGKSLVCDSFDLAQPGTGTGVGTDGTDDEGAAPVTVADVTSRIPCDDASVDIAVSCLALMGTDWLGTIVEAHRVLRAGGVFWIAEIKSRFQRPEAVESAAPARDATVGAQSTAAPARGTVAEAGKLGKRGGKNNRKQTSLQQGGTSVEIPAEAATAAAASEAAFIAELRRSGFDLLAKDDANKMFVRFDFIKSTRSLMGSGGTRGVGGKKSRHGKTTSAGGSGGAEHVSSLAASLGLDMPSSGAHKAASASSFSNALSSSSKQLANKPADDVSQRGLSILKPCIYKRR